MLGIGDGFEEGFEPGCSATVFGRGTAFAVDISWIFGVRFALSDGFEGDDMLPAVAHVVGVEELAEATIQQGFELDTRNNSSRFGL